MRTLPTKRTTITMSKKLMFEVEADNVLIFTRAELVNAARKGDIIQVKAVCRKQHKPYVDENE